MNDALTKTASLEPGKELCAVLGKISAQEMVDIFCNTLQTDLPQLNNSFKTQNWQQTFFFSEKLLGIAVYFNAPKLQAALKEATDKAYKKTLTQNVLDKLNKEIDAILQANAG